MTKRRDWINYRLVMLILFATVIFIGSSIHGNNIPNPAPDYVMHFMEYGLLGLLSAFWFETTPVKRMGGKKALFFASVLFCTIFGLSDEIHQYFVPGRCCDPKDWLVDILGGMAGAAVLILILKAKNPAKGECPH